MTNARHTALPSLDEMLSSLLLIEEGEHEFHGADGSAQEALRQHLFPVTRNCGLDPEKKWKVNLKKWT
jgi:hypothetical protein